MGIRAGRCVSPRRQSFDSAARLCYTTGLPSFVPDVLPSALDRGLLPKFVIWQAQDLEE